MRAAVRPIWIAANICSSLRLPEAAQPDGPRWKDIFRVERFTIQQMFTPPPLRGSSHYKEWFRAGGGTFGWSYQIIPRGCWAYVQFILPHWKDEKMMILPDYRDKISTGRFFYVYKFMYRLSWNVQWAQSRATVQLWPSTKNNNLKEKTKKGRGIQAFCMSTWFCHRFANNGMLTKLINGNAVPCVGLMLPPEGLGMAAIWSIKRGKAVLIRLPPVLLSSPFGFCFFCFYQMWRNEWSWMSAWPLYTWQLYERAVLKYELIQHPRWIHNYRFKRITS